MAVINNTPLFFQERDGPWCPTLRVLHQYPDMMSKLRCDKGAIKFVLSGANIMCPGLTSPGATIHDEVRTWGGGRRLSRLPARCRQRAGDRTVRFSPDLAPERDFKRPLGIDCPA